MIAKLLPLLFTLGVGVFEYRIKKAAAGVGLMIASGFFFLLALVFGLMSMFFALADLNQFIAPSLITGGVIILVAILIAIQGKRIMYKKPLR